MKTKTLYVCRECGHSTPKWLGRCPECSMWNSLIEEAAPGRGKAQGKVFDAPRAQPLDSIRYDDVSRIPSGVNELDRVLGGGIVPGSVTLLGGDPGVGKTTLLLESLGDLSRREEMTVLFCSGEESPRQIKLRADRLGLTSPRLFICARNTVEEILEEVHRLKPAVLAVDSIQTVTSGRIESMAGSVSQVRQAASELISMSKTEEIPLFLVGHVTKEGSLAGPRVLEHMVDTVLTFEGEHTRNYRILRSSKNRFGSTNEIGVFEMAAEGLREVANPSRLFLRDSDEDLAGSVVTAALEGTRPFLVEVQGLCAPTGFSVPRRGSSGADPNRFAMLAAVLEKKMGVDIADQDMFLNFAGGLKVVEPAADTGIIAALYSSFRSLPIDHRTIVFGEVGLTGEVRAVPSPEIRLGEAAKLGFRRCFMPQTNLSGLNKDKYHIETHGINHVSSLVDALFS